VFASRFRFWVSHFFKSISVCLLESFGNVRWLFVVIARISLFGFVILQKLFREISTSVLVKSFCKPSLFGYVGWLAM